MEIQPFIGCSILICLFSSRDLQNFMTSSAFLVAQHGGQKDGRIIWTSDNTFQRTSI